MVSGVSREEGQFWRRYLRYLESFSESVTDAVEQEELIMCSEVRGAVVLSTHS